MLQIKTPEEKISATSEKVFNFLSNFTANKLSSVIGINNWETFDGGCKFDVQGAVSCKLQLTDKTPFSRVTYEVQTDKNINAIVSFDIIPCGESSILQANLSADVPFFLQPMLKGVANNYIGTAMKYIKTAIENS